MFSNPPSDDVPSLNPLQHVVSRQLVTVMFLMSRGSGPIGFSLLRQMASSPVTIEQFVTRTFWQPVRSIPSVFGPLIGFRIEIPVISTSSQLSMCSVHPAEFAS